MCVGVNLVIGSYEKYELVQHIKLQILFVLNISFVFE